MDELKKEALLKALQSTRDRAEEQQSQDTFGKHSEIIQREFPEEVNERRQTMREKYDMMHPPKEVGNMTDKDRLVPWKDDVRENNPSLFPPKEDTVDPFNPSHWEDNMNSPMEFAQEEIDMMDKSKREQQLSDERENDEHQSERYSEADDMPDNISDRVKQHIEQKNRLKHNKRLLELSKKYEGE